MPLNTTYKKSIARNAMREVRHCAIAVYHGGGKERLVTHCYEVKSVRLVKRCGMSIAQAGKIDSGIYIREIKDLQIVNGGQTTASLFHTSRKDKASLEKIFVQMKLSVVDSEKGEEVIPRISEYANTQNKVNAADFFSNHPFHIRMEEFSRRLWAPPQQGALRESKWFYERARGQYSDAQAKISKAEKKKFLA